MSRVSSVPQSGDVYQSAEINDPLVVDENDISLQQEENSQLDGLSDINGAKAL